ncbi:hypothetical protein H6F38_14255 [Paenibacillus sp. EKM208P]|nr:hypothetical protein H6F38_14255 [Paenibacillus sp. EKM208P]
MTFNEYKDICNKYIAFSKKVERKEKIDFNDIDSLYQILVQLNSVKFDYSGFSKKENYEAKILAKEVRSIDRLRLIAKTIESVNDLYK